MKNENHEKLMFLNVFGQYGGFNLTPEVKIHVYTKFEINRRELEYFLKIVNIHIF